MLIVFLKRNLFPRTLTYMGQIGGMKTFLEWQQKKFLH